MDTNVSQKERNDLISAIKDVKTSQLNKLNYSTIKMGTIVAFLASAFIFIINDLPNKKPDVSKIYYLIITYNYLFSSFSVGFSVFNLLFRKKAAKNNMLLKHNAFRDNIISQ